MRSLFFTHYKAILGRDVELEALAVADHIEGLVAKHRQEADHAQHVGLTGQHIATNLLIISDFAFFGAADRGVNIDGGLHGADLGGFAIDVVD